MLWLLLSVPLKLWPTSEQLLDSNFPKMSYLALMTHPISCHMTPLPYSFLKLWSASQVKHLNTLKNYGEHIEMVMIFFADCGPILSRPIVFEHLSALLSSPSQYSILLIERAVVCLLRLCQILAQHVSSPHFLQLTFSYLEIGSTARSSIRCF